MKNFIFCAMMQGSEDCWSDFSNYYIDYSKPFDAVNRALYRVTETPEIDLY